VSLVFRKLIVLVILLYFYSIESHAKLS